MNRYFRFIRRFSGICEFNGGRHCPSKFISPNRDEPIAAVQSVAIDQQPVDTNFSYQGRLKRQGAPYTGSCTFQFELCGCWRHTERINDAECCGL